MEIILKDDAGNVHIFAIPNESGFTEVLWRDLAIGEKIRAGDRMMGTDFAWHEMTEDIFVPGEVYTVCKLPTQRRVTGE